MEQIATVHYSHDPEKDKPLRQSLTKMRVHNRNTMNLQIGGLGAVVPPGVHEVLVYASEVSNVMSMVEDDQPTADQAEKQHRLRIAAEVRASCDNTHGQYTAEQIDKMIREGNDSVLNGKHATIQETTPNSYESAFEALAQRSIRPLISAEVLETGIPEPQREGMAAENTKMAQAIGEAVGKALREALGGPAPSVNGEKRKQ
jgi:hypothetical protein